MLSALLCLNWRMQCQKSPTLCRRKERHGALTPLPPRLPRPAVHTGQRAPPAMQMYAVVRPRVGGRFVSKKDFSEHQVQQQYNANAAACAASLDASVPQAMKT